MSDTPPRCELVLIADLAGAALTWSGVEVRCLLRVQYVSGRYAPPRLVGHSWPSLYGYSGYSLSSSSLVSLRPRSATHFPDAESRFQPLTS